MALKRLKREGQLAFKKAQKEKLAEQQQNIS